MNYEELLHYLKKEKIREDYYWLKGGLPNERLCIFFNGEKWEVYYSERGGKSLYKEFLDEESACEYFLSWIEEARKWE